MTVENPAKESSALETRPVSEEDLRAIFSGPALHSNRMFATNLAAGMRIAFMEQVGEHVPPIFRTAVVLAYSDAVHLRDLLNRQLEPIEKSMKEALSAQSSGGDT